MNDINWRDAPKLTFDPNIIYKVKFAYADPGGPYQSKEHPDWAPFITWGVFYEGNPCKIIASTNSTLIQLLKRRGISQGDEVEILYTKRGDIKEWSVDGQILEDSQLPTGENPQDSIEDPDISKMIQNIEKMKDYLSKIQVKIKNQDEAIIKLRNIKTPPKDDPDLPF